jgi:hydrogenase-4 component E
MTGYANLLLVTLLALDLYMVSTTRIDACIRASILQAIVLAVLPFALGSAGPHASLAGQLHLVVLAGATQVVKGIVIPWLLLRALRDLGSHREFEPFVSLHHSQLVNGLLCGAAFWMASALPWPAARTSPLALGLFVAGWTLLGQPSLLVELGVLLDLLVASMVMGILATRIEAVSAEPRDSRGAA